EYFISTHGSRKGMSDTALRTADAGYLTRRLVDVAQDIVINAEDCGTEEFTVITRAESEAMNRPLDKRVFGRVVAADILSGGQVVVKKNEAIDELTAKKIAEEYTDVEEVKCRSVLKCRL